MVAALTLSSLLVAPSLLFRPVASVWHEKMERRAADPAIAPTFFLWNPFIPNRYYYEVCTSEALQLRSWILHTEMVSC